MIDIIKQYWSYLLVQRITTAIGLFVVLYLFFFVFPPLYFLLLLGLGGAYIVRFEWPRLFTPRHSIFWLLLPVYLLLPFILLAHLNEKPAYRFLLFVGIMLVACFDVCAYLIGRFFGRHKIVPAISPSKTIEGLIGGLLGVFSGVLCVQYYNHHSLTVGSSFAIASVFSLLAFSGDLFESWLKRRAGIKDTGTLLPGHGGLLDRIDSLLFVVFFLYFCRDYLIKILGLA